MLLEIKRYHYSTKEIQRQLIEVNSIGRDDANDETILSVADGTKRYARMSQEEHNNFVHACYTRLREQNAYSPICVFGLWYQRSGALSRSTIKKVDKTGDVYTVM